MSIYSKMCGVEELVGKTFDSVSQEIRGGNDAIVFAGSKTYVMTHIQDCCETVQVEDICGDLEDLKGSEIVDAREETSDENSSWGSLTWTFYVIRTNKGSVTIRWKGESNGYYSESVDIYED